MMEIKQKPSLHATWIDVDAVQIVEQLQKAGFVSYLVGGCVRDLLAGLHPKDFDIATNALPNEVRRKIWGSYVIGKRFRLVLAKRNDQQYEIATFRRESTPEDFVEGEETPMGDNFFGTPEQDALRRDFTINSLFYDPIKNELIDYAKGVADIDSQTIRMIGDPKIRIIEDPIRSLRAIRLAHKLKFSIEESLRSAIQELAFRVALSVLPRRREEYLKFLRLNDPIPAFAELYDLGLMEHLLPSLKKIWDVSEKLDIFYFYMQTKTAFNLDLKNPVDVYLPLILAFIRATENDQDQKILLDSFMRQELGMFKSEIAEILAAIELSTKFPDIESFKKRGHRRQTAFLRQPELALATKIAKFDQLLSAKELAFWVRG